MRISGLLLPLLLTAVAAADNWPQWRGPTGDGHAGANAPTSWSATENIAWKTPIEGWGTSTPIVWGDKVFITTQIGDGPVADGARDFDTANAAKSMGNDGGVRFVVKAVSLADGSSLWEKSFRDDDDLVPVHVKHNLASPSCVTDGELVYAWFGTGHVAALTFDGELVWERKLRKENATFDVRWGHGTSPALYGDILYLLVDHPDKSYLLAVDKATGKDLWRKDRGQGKRSYTTPLMVEAHGEKILVVNTNVGLQALSPDNGDLLWQVGEENRVPVPMPVHHDGTLYSSRGYNSSPYLAIDIPLAAAPGGGSLEPKWRTATGAPYISSLVYANGLVFMATERGIATAVRADSGEVAWKTRLGGSFSASPIVSDGKVFFVDEAGVTYIVAASAEYELLATNDLGERTLASPALADGTLLIRTDDHLFAIRE